MQAALARFGAAFAASVAAEVQGAEGTSPPSSGAPPTPSPDARRGGGGEGSPDGTAAMDEEEDGPARDSAVEAVRARLHALSSTAVGHNERVKVRLPERPPVA